MKKVLLYLGLLVTGFDFIGYGQNGSLQGKELYSSNFIIDGIQRNFTYYMPLNYGKKDQYPLLLFLHDSGETGKNIIKSYGDMIHAKADTSDCIVLYPDAIAGHWNDMIGDSFPATDTINDVGFFSILIDYFIQQYNADANRVYVAGFANGGKMAYRLGCNIPSKITAIAPFRLAEDTIKRCNNAQSIPVIGTNKFSKQTSPKPDRNAISEAMDFLLSHAKK